MSTQEQGPPPRSLPGFAIPPNSKTSAIRSVQRSAVNDVMVTRTCNVHGTLPDREDVYAPVHVVENPGCIVTVVQMQTSVYGPSDWKPSE